MHTAVQASVSLTAHEIIFKKVQQRHDCEIRRELTCQFTAYFTVALPAGDQPQTDLMIIIMQYQRKYAVIAWQIRSMLWLLSFDSATLHLFKWSVNPLRLSYTVQHAITQIFVLS
jgi:hypothetical protein